MRLATSCHHTNPRSATLHFWRQTSSIDEYKRIQHMRRIQTNQPTSSNHKPGFHFDACSMALSANQKAQFELNMKTSLRKKNIWSLLIDWRKWKNDELEQDF